LINALECYVTIIGLGEIASSASVIMQAADKRLLTTHSLMMIHTISLGCEEDKLANIESLVKISKLSEECILDIYELKSHMTKKQIRSKWSTDWFLTTAEAVQLGFADGRY